MSCEHDKRFHLMFARNGCCACELEAAMAEVERLKGQCNILADALGNALQHCPPSYSGPIIEILKSTRKAADAAGGDE